MENYVGKICSFCKTTITANDEVMVCPSCATPHHKACWEENKGCTTFGCSEQHYVAQETNSTDVCKKCGAALGDGQTFCPKCGHKVGLTVDSGVSSAISQFNDNQTKKNKKKIVVPIAVVAIAVALIGGGIFLAPKIFISVDDLCAKGNYTEAYKKSKYDEKLKIKAESIAAERSAYSADNLKDPSSFKLRDVYYKEGTDDDGDLNGYLVLHINATNSYGGSISNCWLYTWENDKQEWEYFCSVSDLSDEEYSTYDDTDEKLEKLLNNIGRRLIKDTMKDGIKLDKAAINRINGMFEEGTLDNVEPIKRTES